jgi:hypothetical protein
MRPPAGGAILHTTRVRRSEAARAARSGDELVLLQLERGVYFTLNETGARLWEAIGEGATAGALRDALVASFEVAPEEAWNDVVELLGELADEALVRLD